MSKCFFRIIPEENCFKLRLASDPDFVKDLAEQTNNLGINCLLPCVDEELTKISEETYRFPNTEVILPQQSFISFCLDKASFSEKLATHNLGPRVVKLEEGNKTNQELIIKPRYGRGSRGICFINEINKVRSYLDLNSMALDEIVIQERLRGTEFTVTNIADERGELIAVYPLQIVKKKGITIHAIGSRNEKVIEYCKEIHELFKPNYIYNVQLILTENEKPLAFEINPRISTTFCTIYAFNSGSIDQVMNSIPENSCPSRWSSVSIKRSWLNHYSCA